MAWNTIVQDHMLTRAINEKINKDELYLNDVVSQWLYNDRATTAQIIKDEVNKVYGSPKKSPEIKTVIFNDPAPVVYWDDGTKTVVKCQEGDTFDKYYGLAMAISKKFLGNKGNFNEVFKKYIEEDK